MASFQPSTQSQDELAALFSRNMTFDPAYQSQIQSQEQLQPQNPPQRIATPEPAEQDKMQHHQQQQNKHVAGEPTPPVSPATTSHPIIYSVSQHYTHSAHVAHVARQNNPSQEVTGLVQSLHQVQEPQRRSSDPTQSGSQPSAESLLSFYGVDPAVLSPSQLQLFRISENHDKERLIEMWRAAPPTNNEDNPALAWTSTTVEQEELWARLRYERMMENERQRQEEQQQQQQQCNNATMSLDGTQVQAQDTDGRWIAAAYAQHAEPYMMSGYEEMMKREAEKPQPSPQYSQATDPVYKSNGDDLLRQQQQVQEQMACQYGAFQQQQQQMGSRSGMAGNDEAMEIL